jgi:hypothetical protein
MAFGMVEARKLFAPRNHGRDCTQPIPFASSRGDGAVGSVFGVGEGTKAVRATAGLPQSIPFASSGAVGRGSGAVGRGSGTV